MKLVIAFLRLIRWPNLVFIVLTQLLFFYCIIDTKLVNPVETSFGILAFMCLIVATVLIAAAGYIINDYFDLNIDAVNKPNRLIIDKVIKRRWAIVMHILLSGAGVLLSFYIGSVHRYYWLGISNLLCVFLLFGYSITLKRKLLIGNILISALTAWVILVVFFCFKDSFLPAYIYDGVDHTDYVRLNNSITRLAFLYAGFAFIISLIREVTKDMEDMEGDGKYGCKTMPIVWGVPATKVFVAVWIIVLTGVLGTVQFYVLQFGWWWSAVYCVVLIIAPLLWILYKLYKAQVPKDYRLLSAAVKFVMFTGIMSMLFFKIYS